MTHLWESSIAITKPGRGLKDFSLSPLFGEDSHFDLHIFFNSGLVQLVKVKDRLGTCFVIPKRGFYMSPIFFNISPESPQKNAGWKTIYVPFKMVSFQLTFVHFNR